MGISVRSKTFWIITIPLAAILAISALFVRMYFYEPNQLEVTTIQVPVKQWAGTQKRATLCVVADLHWRPTDNLKSRAIIDKMIAQKPDVFLLLGDYVFGDSKNNSMRSNEITQKLSFLTSTGTPCFAVFGNHDAYCNRNVFSRELKEAGIHPFMDAEIVVLKLSGGREIAIGGTWDAHSYFEIFDDSCVPKNPNPKMSPFVLLSHSPDVVQWLNETVDLALCGHTHGGQICLPGGKPIFTSTKTEAGKRYAYGLSTLPKGGKIFTTRGTGTSILPFRLFCLPEIVVIELVPGTQEGE